jgi:hypothetical protein
MANGALYVSRSKNAKIGDADATYLSIKATCPTSCALRDSGCYAQDGKVVMTVKRLDAEATSGVDANLAECKAIDDATPDPSRPLRLHVSGDVTKAGMARALGNAVARWLKRGGPVAWTYTHSWRKIGRFTFGPISVLASIDSLDQAEAARKKGYAPAVVVDSHPADGRAWDHKGIRYIPCPAQTRDDVTCVSCRLCFDADALYKRRAGIAFEAHGSRRYSIARRVVSLPLFVDT